MKHLLILLFAGLICLPGLAQKRTTIAEIVAGKVINEVTNEPISYTNIGLENTMIGTASNAEGKFRLGIPKDMIDRNIYFSALGFKNDTFPVSQLFTREYSIIKLEPQSYDIENVDVAVRSRVLERVLRMAAENIPYNFISGPFNLSATYTNKKTVDFLQESEEKFDVLIYDKTGYSNPSKLDACQWRNYALNKSEQEEKDFTFSTGTTHLDDLLEFDLVRTASSMLDPAILDRFELSLKGEPTIDGEPAWVISFREPQPSLSGSGDFYANWYEGEITVNKADYAVKKITGKVRSPKNNRQGKSLAVGPSVKNFYTDVDYNFTIVYSNLKPDYIELSRKYRFNGKDIEETTRLDIQKVQTTDLTQLESREYFTGE